jgi:hypothetical protein
VPRPSIITTTAPIWATLLPVAETESRQEVGVWVVVGPV